MRKRFYLVLIVLLSIFTFSSCLRNGNKNEDYSNKTKEELEIIVNEKLLTVDAIKIVNDFVEPTGKDIATLRILTVNDFHGALISEQAGAARLGDYLIKQRNLDPDGTIILAAGDMFQGTGISNYRYGLDVIKWMNAVKFEAMTLGNHEFDWGIEQILKYRDNDLTNGEANFPFLGANIVNKRTGENLENTQCYTIIQKGQYKVGIIGYMGYGLESSIAVSKVKDYQFLSVASTIGPMIEEMRVVHGADIIIAMGHDGSETTNQQVAQLTGNQAVDAIINAHTHLYYSNLISASNKRSIPLVQAGSSGSHVGEIILTIEHSTKKITSSNVKTTGINEAFPENASIKNFIDELVKATDPLFGRVIGTSGRLLTSQYSTVQYVTDALRDYAGADVAYVNFGGVRAAAFPIQQDEKITIAKIYQMLPFDNVLKTTKLKGKYIRILAQNGQLASSSNVDAIGSTIKIDGEALQDEKEYLVATIDYVFDANSYPFDYGSDTVLTEVLLRDIVIESIENLTKNKQNWMP